MKMYRTNIDLVVNDILSAIKNNNKLLEKLLNEIEELKKAILKNIEQTWI